MLTKGLVNEYIPSAHTWQRFEQRLEGIQESLQHTPSQDVH